MALSDLILQEGRVIVTISQSIAGIVTDPNAKALNFGTIQKVSDLEDFFEVGQSVQFDIEKGEPFLVISGITFYLLHTSDINFKETTPP